MLISKKDLMERWQCNSNALYRKEGEGVLHRCPHVPGVMYRLEEVERCEGLGDVDPLSPFERRHLESEIQKRDAMIRKLQDKIQKATAVLFMMEERA